MISIKNLKKEYDHITPLSDVNLEVNKGEVISIIGPSGTGKSTLLRCINMLEEPTEGSIIVDGEDITVKGYDLSKLRKRMGMVFQQFNLFSHMNVIENISYAPMHLLGLSKEAAEAKAMDLLKMVSLTDKAYSYPDELSGGQQQRIAIARTLAMDPEIILFDEPTSALDPTMTAEVLTVIKMLAAKGMTMMIVTHEMRFAKDVSSRVLYMDQGIIYEDGTPDEIFDHPQKELTRRFVNKLKVLDIEVKRDDFDFIGQAAEIEKFGRKQLMSQRVIYGAQVVFEEFCIQTLLTRYDKLRFVIEHDESDNAVKVQIHFGTKNDNPIKDMNYVSEKLVHNVTDGILHEFTNGENIVTLKIKNY